MKNNFWNIVGIVLLIFLAIMLLNNFTGVIEKSDILNFYSNLLVVIITVTLGIITYEQTKHIQEESSKETDDLRRLNKEANETNKKLVDIIKRNTELEEQRNMPCVAMSQRKKYINDIANEIEIEFKNIGPIIIKHIDISEISEEMVKNNIFKTIEFNLEVLKEVIIKAFKCLSIQDVKKIDFLEYFNHDIDMVAIGKTFNINTKPKKIGNNEENLYVVALKMNIETIYGKKYNEDVVILLKKEKNKKNEIYNIQGKYIDISKEK